MRKDLLLSAHLMVIVALLALTSSYANAQTRECATRDPDKKDLLFVSPESMRAVSALPIQLNVMVTVFADNNGTAVAAEDTSILRQLENMQEFYAPQDICFNLIGIRHVNDTDLNNMNVGTEESDLFPFLAPNVINMFVHNALFDSETTYNGNAYHIPNTYFSVVGSAIQSGSNRSTAAHEMGHCLGLYHTFAGDELVDRVGPCSNCSTDGDLLCDTPADPHSDSYDTGNWIDANCNYFGTVTDDCDRLYVMDPHNIMAYGRRACRDVFTNGQGSRMAGVVFISPSLTDCLTDASVTFSPSLNQTVSSGWAIYAASSQIVVQGSTFTINGSAQGQISGTSVRIKPKVHFDPGSTGSVHVLIGSVLCD